jgi:hypothetical protein
MVTNQSHRGTFTWCPPKERVGQRRAARGLSRRRDARYNDDAIDR